MVWMNKPARTAAGSAATEETVTERPGHFEDFFLEEHERLLRALYVLTADRHEAEELMQDAFLAVWERWDRVGRMHEATGYMRRPVTCIAPR